MASNKNRSRNKIVQVAKVIVVDTEGNQYSLDPEKIVVSDKETGNPLFKEIK